MVKDAIVLIADALGCKTAPVPGAAAGPFYQSSVYLFISCKVWLDVILSNETIFKCKENSIFYEFHFLVSHQAPGEVLAW